MGRTAVRVGCASAAMLLALMVSAIRPALAAERTVWRLGAPDGSSREFALSGDHLGWRNRFGGGVRVSVADAGATAAWPWIHPGPADAWAGGALHTYHLHFNLSGQPAPAYRLTVRLVAAQAPIGARYRIDLNGASGEFVLAPGPGDHVLSEQQSARPIALEVPAPGALLRAGENRLSLTVTSGSWVVYDALALDVVDRVPQAALTMPQVMPTGLLLRRGTGVVQPVDVVVPGAATLRPEVRVWADGASLPVGGRGLALGDHVVRVEVPERGKPVALRVRVADSGSTIERRFTLRPVRRWRIYVAAATHFDIGYTDLQANTVKVHSRDVDLAIEFAKRYPTFKWNVEAAWAMDDFLRTRSPERIAEFARLAREGRIGVEALHSHLLTGLLSDEQMVRALYYSHALARRHGFRIRSATLTDVPSHVWSLPTVLRHCGIRYLSMGINQDRGPILHYGGLHLRSPVWWEGPDGSRVLAMFHGGYAQGHRFRGGPDAVREQVLSVVRDHERRRDYPYDAIHMHGAFGDNQGMDEALAETVEEWNREVAYPRLILATNDEFFAHIEQRYGRRLPVVRGCGSSYWEDGAASSARETAMNRVAHGMASTAETLLALQYAAGLRREYPAVRLGEMWNQILLYDEHTWGAWNSISQPEIEFVRQQFAVKAAFAHRGAAEAKALLSEALRGEAVRQGARPVSASGLTLESRHYRVRLDPTTGSVASIIDRGTGSELVEAGAPHGFGQVVYASGSNSRAIHPDLSQPPPPFVFTAPRCTGVTASPEGLTAHLDHPVLGRGALRVSLPSEERRVDISVEFDKQLTYAKESVYVAFPFAGAAPTITYAIGNGAVQAGRDWLPGACLDWFAVQDWVRLRRQDGLDVVWSSPDAPLIQLQGIQTGQWLRALPITNGRLYSYVLNNYWHTNYLAGQGGRFQFRYALTTGSRIDDAAAQRFGQSVCAPDLTRAERLVRVAPDNVVLIGAKWAEDGDGLIVRLRELNGRRSAARIRLQPGMPVPDAAFECTGVEEIIRPARVRGREVTAPVAARGLATVRIRFRK
ncbi:MAG TPA: polysaccharide lyase family protein [Chthonomonadales bacterium]|nr:polysaccharide lyase family protein [Chthonomonadales bacterium]